MSGWRDATRCDSVPSSLSPLLTLISHAVFRYANRTASHVSVSKAKYFARCTHPKSHAAAAVFCWTQPGSFFDGHYLIMANSLLVLNSAMLIIIIIMLNTIVLGHISRNETFTLKQLRTYFLFILLYAFIETFLRPQ